MDDALLSIRGVCTDFARPAGTIRVLDDVSIDVRRGEVVGLIGESGIGKSLLLSSVLGVVMPPGHVAEGQALFDGRDLIGMPERELNRIRGKEISFIGPNPHTLLNPLVPVGEQVVKFLRAHYDVARDDARQRTRDMFDAVGIPDPDRRLKSYPHELSGGMAQRVVISIGLICSPRLILADEPTFGLDVTIQAQVLELVMELVAETEERAMLLVTRDLGIVANYCDTLYVMHDGRIVESGPVDEFFRQQATSYGKAFVQASDIESQWRDAQERARLAAE